MAHECFMLSDLLNTVELPAPIQKSLVGKEKSKPFTKHGFDESREEGSSADLERVPESACLLS